MTILGEQIQSLKAAAKWQRRARAKELKKRILEAESWGVPGQWNHGMSHVELVSLLREARLYIERLEKELSEY